MFRLPSQSKVGMGAVPISWKLAHVCAPVKKTGRKLGSTKYLGLVGLTRSGPVAGEKLARDVRTPATAIAATDPHRLRKLRRFMICIPSHPPLLHKGFQ